VRGEIGREPHRGKPALLSPSHSFPLINGAPGSDRKHERRDKRRLGYSHTAKEEEEMSIFPTRILLATDGSEEAELALLTAVDLANRTDSELHVVHVGFAPVPIGAEVAPVAADSRLRDKLIEEARSFLDSQVEKIEAAGGTVAQAHLGLTGRPDEEILDLAEEIGAGLIAMGSRGLGGIKRALMGSVSDSVVRHAHCPVLIVRAEKGSRRYLEGSVSTTRRARREGAEKKWSFWDMLLACVLTARGGSRRGE
jgi:nucleotide-binding universal stress UspA family protein